MIISDEQIMKVVSYLVPVGIAWLMKLRRDVNSAWKAIRKLQEKASKDG